MFSPQHFSRSVALDTAAHSDANQKKMTAVSPAVTHIPDEIFQLYRLSRVIDNKQHIINAGTQIFTIVDIDRFFNRADASGTKTASKMASKLTLKNDIIGGDDGITGIQPDIYGSTLPVIHSKYSIID